MALPALHSLIHVTWNRVIHRFIAYVLTTFVLWAIWAVFAVSLA